MKQFLTKIELTHIDNIKVGDTVKHNGNIITVSGNNIEYNTFMGTTIFGDSYKLGTKPVEKITFITK